MCSVAAQSSTIFTSYNYNFQLAVELVAYNKIIRTFFFLEITSGLNRLQEAFAILETHEEVEKEKGTVGTLWVSHYE